MAFSFTDDQEQFRDIVARFCRDKSPTTKVRELMATDTGYDSQVWQQLCQEVGLAGIHIAEDKGGAGFGPVELGIVMEEFGRSLLCTPYFGTAVLTATAIANVASQSQIDTWLPQLVDGSCIGALAISEMDGQFDTNKLQTKATAADDGFLLNGSKRFVVDGHIADLVIVAAQTDAGPALFAVKATASGLQRHLMASMDPTRKIAELSFSDTPAERLGNAAELDLTPVFNTALVALANEMVGGAQALLDSAIEYSKLRVQFGRTIGSFQAIKHRLADLLLEVELAKSAAYQAAQVMAAGEDATELASLAKATASEAYLQASIQCIQLHVGIGFTWENDTHLWFKRAKSSEVFLGTPNQHRERMLQAMGV
jgi:alkylation response protein AidB-like acyl-CoA dehydrogenase